MTEATTAVVLMSNKAHRLRRMLAIQFIFFNSIRGMTNLPFPLSIGSFRLCVLPDPVESWGEYKKPPHQGQVQSGRQPEKL